LYETILQVENAGLVSLTLNRPGVLNAMNDTMAAELLDALDRAADDPTVRAVLLTGAGRAFLAGQDLNSVDDMRAAGSFSEHLAATWNPLIRRLWTLEKPVVAAVNGAAVGAGCAVALACDLVLASERAVFVAAFSKLGFIPDAGLTWLLPRLVGMPRALEIIYLGESVHADRALQLGLVKDVVPPETLLKRATGLALRLADGPTLAYGAAKRAMHDALELSLDDAMDREGSLQDLVGETADNREGVAAFFEKRIPLFRGA
jgi:2-(1,2-epoxy-1,2-dihydrophenyl)acetyl-CoA isomerase